MGHFRHSLILGILLLLQFQLRNAVKINSDGGYEVLVAIDENSPVPSGGAARYISNIKNSLNVFSNHMWMTTNYQFHLRSVDILIPSSWSAGSDIPAATTQSFPTSDLRLSPTVRYPHAENPNICGQPGNFIELPDSFFSAANSGPYGLHWKSLLHTWALYRWGVHSEHGYAGNEKFPYAYRDGYSRDWAVTGCSDETISGSFVDLENPEQACESEDEISSSCRFVPAPVGQNATTSLMHFHWIESVTHFCDENTHDKHSPNKQNALCDHKSVWEVIRETPDYLAVTTPQNASIRPITFRTVSHSATPVFYLLLDRGLIQGSFSIANKLPRLLSPYFTDPSLANTVASIGAYPGSGSDFVTSLVEWSEIGTNLDAFLVAIGDLKMNGPLERDFSRALISVAEKVKQRNHPNGAVVLLIKYGADVASFGGYLAESEVLNAFNEGNIIFNSIELNFPGSSGFSHLARISQGTGGGYTLLNSFGEAENSIRNVLTYVCRTLQTDYTDLRKRIRTLRRDGPSLSSTVLIPSGIRGSLQIYVSTFNANLTASNFTVTGYNYSDPPVPPRQLTFTLRTPTRDWNEQGSKYTYSLAIPQSELSGSSQIGVQLSCPGSTGGCVSNILARADFQDNIDDIRAEVLTSLESGVADLSSGQPVTMFAKVTKNGIPVRDAIVIATLTETATSRTTQIRLVDNGEGAPDVQELDGIYSEYFAPETDGEFRLTISVEGNPLLRTSMKSERKQINEGSFIRLLPVDQSDLGCGAGNCEAETIEGYAQAIELPSPFSVVQTALYSPTPTKIFTLGTLDRPTIGQIDLFWHSPIIPGRLIAATSYEMRSAPTRELLINDFDNQAPVPLPPTFSPQPPGRLESLRITKPMTTTYYAVRSVYRGKRSALSNIAEFIGAFTATTPSDSTTVPSTPSEPTSSTDPTAPSTSTNQPPTDPTASSSSTNQPPTDPTAPSTSTNQPPTDPTASSSSTNEPPTDSTTTADPGTSSTEGAASFVGVTNGFVLSCLLVLFSLTKLY